MEQDYIKSQVDNRIMEINSNNNIFEVGVVVNVKDFIIEVAGLENVMFYEKINVENKAFGYVCNLGENVVTVALLKIEESINIGDSVYSTNKIYTGSYSPSSFGRIVDLFGEDKLSSKTFTDLNDVPIERKTIPIMDRGTVNRPLLTGIAGIDLMYPIGKGQRQLIIGDKRTGKTQIVLDTIVNQKDKNVLCFYVAIGKTKKEVKNIYSELVKRGAIAYTTIITAFNDELPPVISLIPYFALSVAEDYMMQGYDVLVCIDDLKRHAEAYREISLISGKKPARDAYPADIFYAHSRLLEKGCQYKDGGSITILPIVETKGGDITDYISTNIISITDGQIVLSANSFQKGEKPAINYGLSVSRLGGAVQNTNMKKIGSVVRQKLLSYLETRSVYELVNVDDMSVELRNQFMEGKIILSNLSQYKFSPKTEEEMISTFTDFLENSSPATESTNNDANNTNENNDGIDDNIVNDANVSFDSSVVNDANTAYDTNMAYNGNVVNDANVSFDSGVVNDANTVYDTNSVNDTNVAYSASAVNDTNVSFDSGVVNDANTVYDTNSVNNTNAAYNANAVNDTNVSFDSSVVNDANIVYDTNAAYNASAVNDINVSSDSCVVNDANTAYDINSDYGANVTYETNVPEIVSSSSVDYEEPVLVPTNDISVENDLETLDDDFLEVNSEQ